MTGTAVTTTRPAAPKPQMMAGGPVAALVPQTLDEAFRVATAIAASGLAPKGVDTTEKVLVALMAGAELGFAPFQAMQSFAIINGKPNIWGDAIPALLWSRGFKIKEWFDNDDEPTKAFCLITRPDGEEIERTYSIADARKAGLLGKQGPWQTNQKRMLQMRARGFGARDGAADVLRGMQVAEEVQDYGPVRDVTDRPAPNLAARLAGPKEDDAPAEGFTVHNQPADDTADHDSETGEVTEPQAGATYDPRTDDSFPGDQPSARAGDEAGPAEADAVDETGPAADLLQWQRKLLEDMDGLSLDQLDHLTRNPSDIEMFTELEASQPQLAMDLNKAITRRRKELG